MKVETWLRHALRCRGVGLLGHRPLTVEHIRKTYSAAHLRPSQVLSASVEVVTRDLLL